MASFRTADDARERGRIVQRRRSWNAGSVVPYALALLGFACTLALILAAVREVRGFGADAAPAAAAETNLTGIWVIEDTVTAADGSSATYRFAVRIEEDDGTVRSTGNGLSLAGRRDGSTVTATFRSGEQTGEFAWTVQPDGSLAGTFSASEGQVTGRSIALPVR